MLKRLSFCFLTFLLVMPAMNAVSQTVITVSVPPGYYPVDQRIELGAGAGAGEEIYYSFAESRYPGFVEYLHPFTLSAIEGEERTYTLQVEARLHGETVRRKEFSYVIDKRPPAAPSVSMPAGTYGNPISVSLLPSAGQRSDCSYYFCVNGSISEDVRLWTGEPIYLGAEDRGVVSHTIKAFAEDAAGNTSELKIWTYIIDVSETAPTEGIQILSPVPGTFANRQYLAIRSSDYEWIRYSLGGEDPADRGAEYVEPFLLDIDGAVHLRVAGKLSSTGEVWSSEVEFTVAEQSVASSRLESGIYDSPVFIQLESRDGLYYSLDDTPAVRKALVYEDPFRIDLVRNGLKYIAFRFIGADDISKEIPESRYFFILDDRTPSQPEIFFSETPPLRDDTEVEILGPEDARIYYTIDGTSPDTSSMEYRGPFTLNLPEDIKVGSLLVRAAAFGANRRRSSVSSSLVTFDRIAPAAPEIIYLGRNSTRGITIGVRSEFGTRIFFEMTLDDTLPGEPSLDSYFSSDGYIDLDVPYGMERIFAFRFAAVDRAGNFSESTEPFRVLIDKRPPDPPVMKLSNSSVTILSSEEVYYTMTTDGSEPPMPDARSHEYTGPIILEPIEGVLNELRIRAIALDKSGNVSSVSETFRFIDDRRRPYLPDYEGPKDGGIYNSGQKLILKLAEEAPLTYYTYTADGSEPPDPDRNSGLVSDEVLFGGREGERVTYRVKLKPFQKEGELAGEVRELAFIVDLEPPDAPVPEGIEDGRTYSHGVLLFPPSDSADEIYLALAANGEELADPLGEKGRRFLAPIRLDTDDGTKRTFRFSLAAIDDAGNSTINPVTYSVAVDREPPPRPVILGIPPGGFSRDNVELTVSSPYPVYYEVSTDGSLPPVPNRRSSLYGEKLVLGGEVNKEILYTAKFVAFDEVGNSSSRAVTRFTVDRLKPEAVSPPQVEFAGDSTVSIAWPGSVENRIYYAVSPNKEASPDRYVVYSGPFTVPYDEKGDSLVLTYYARDKAGNRSDLGSLSLDLPGRTTEDLFTGVENEMLYNSRCTIRRVENQAIVRYEVTTNGPIPARVSPFAAEMPETLHFNAAPGETLRFAVRAAVFQPGKTSPVKEQIVRFTIDKTPPPAPDIPNWQDEMYFQDDFQVELDYSDGNAYISINGGSYVLYTGPITLRSVSGGLDKYVISAYTKDEAGNQSIRTREWIAYIDRQVVYVSSDGNDLFDGSRNRPFRTLAAAIEESRRSGRKTIYLAEGSYAIHEPILLDGAMGIYGGFAAGTWEEKEDPDATSLIVSEELSTKSSVFSIGHSGVVTLHNLSVRSATDRIDGTLIRQNGGKLVISHSQFSFGSCGPLPVYEQRSGNVVIERSVFFAKNVRGNELFKLSGDEFSMNESSVAYEDSTQDVALINASKVKSLTIRSSVLEPGTGRNTSGLSVSLSSVKLSDTRIDSGQAKAQAIALRVRECDVQAEGLILAGNRSAWISTCLDASSSSITMKNAKIDARAARGVVAVRATNTELKLDSTRVRGLAGEEFIYLLDLSNCTGVISNNMMSGSDTRDFIGIHAAGSSITLVHNTMVIGRGTNMSSGIILADSADSIIVNNIIHGPSEYGVAIDTDKAGPKLKILHNAFDGWLVYLKKPGLTAKTIADVNTADQAPASGEIFGNFAERAAKTFSSSGDGVFLLDPDSACINGGFNTNLLNIVLDTDYQGGKRSDPFDIGADEAY